MSIEDVLTEIKTGLPKTDGQASRIRRLRALRSGSHYRPLETTDILAATQKRVAVQRPRVNGAWLATGPALGAMLWATGIGIYYGWTPGINIAEKLFKAVVPKIFQRDDLKRFQPNFPSKVAFKETSIKPANE